MMRSSLTHCLCGHTMLACFGTPECRCVHFAHFTLQALVQGPSLGIDAATGKQGPTMRRWQTA